MFDDLTDHKQMAERYAVLAGHLAERLTLHGDAEYARKAFATCGVPLESPLVIREATGVDAN